MEYIEEVDENNKLTNNICSREEVHRLGKFYREVMCFIINENGEILIQQRAKEKEIKPLKWEICTGHISMGEEPEQSMIRELKEEIDLDVEKQDLKMLQIIKVNEKIKDKFHNVFSYIFMTNTDKKIKDFKLQKEEVRQIKYVKPDRLKEMILKKQEDFCLIVYDGIEKVIDKYIK